MYLETKRPSTKRRHMVHPYDHLWKEFSHEAPSRYYKPWLTSPAVNLIDLDDHFEIQIAIPGFTKEDFKIELNENILEISLEKGQDSSDRSFKKKEFWYGPFHRKFELGASIDQGIIKAEYLNGILTMVMPKKKEVQKPKARKVEVL